MASAQTEQPQSQRQAAPSGTFFLMALGWYPSDEKGSNSRRVLGRIAYVLAIIALIDGFVLGNTPLVPLAVVLLSYSAVIFGFKIVYVLVILSDGNFRPTPARLLGDVVLSSLFAMVAFGYLFQILGIQYTLADHVTVDTMDYYYFAAVTFSTLGYGDFAPSPYGMARQAASFLAVFGNIHLGLLAGSFMALLRPGN